MHVPIAAETHICLRMIAIPAIEQAMLASVPARFLIRSSIYEMHLSGCVN
jgi:hypothetical protein